MENSLSKCYNVWCKFLGGNILNIEETWNYLINRFKEKMASVSYDTWIESSECMQLTQDEITIQVPTKLHKDYWENNLTTTTVELLYELTSREISPVIMTEEEVMNQQQPVEEPSSSESVQENLNTEGKYSQLVEKYTFDSFVIGKGNQMAHAAALVVAEEPGTIYNPLFFYGGVGLGKTHLMHAIGHRLRELNPQANVKYVTSEMFANDFIDSIRNRTQKEFRNEYRQVDLLLVDDIQFFSDKEGTQEEFFHTFNALYDQRKQIVLTSDRLPNEIPKLQERLVSRFAWGLSVDITPPDLETRIAILRSKAEAENLEIPDSTLSYIAGQIDSNIRELEGALLRVQAFATIENLEITTGLAADALKSMLPGKQAVGKNIADIKKAVAKFYDVTVEEINGKKRVQNIVRPRQVAMYLSREITGESFPKIGKEFGGKDHTTVIYAHDKINELLETDFELKNKIDEIKKMLS